MRANLFVFVLAMSFVFYPASNSLDAQQQEGQESSGKKQQAAPQRSIEEERLYILKADVQKEIDLLNKLKKDIEAIRSDIDQKKQESLARIAKMFESMNPEDAARRLEKLDEASAVIILTALKPKSAGKILAQIDTELAASISKKILAKSKPDQEKASR